MKNYTSKVFVVSSGRTTPLPRVTVSASNADRARVALRAELSKKHRVISVNHTGTNTLVAYVEAR